MTTKKLSSDKWIKLLQSIKCKNCGKWNPKNEDQYMFIVNKGLPMCRCETVMTIK